MKECTFRPAIGTKSELYARRARGCSAEPLVERLYHEADKRATLREKAKELVEADEVVALTFTPTVNRTPSKGSNYTPIHQRVDVIQRQKQEKVRVLQQEDEKQLEGAFQPKISEHSRKLAEQRQRKLRRNAFSEGHLGYDALSGSPSSPEGRLYYEAQLQEQRRAAEEESRSQSSAASGPSLDEGSRRICKGSVYFQGAQQDFLTRQNTFEAARQRRRVIRSRHAEAKCSFKPDINVSSRQLVASNLDFLKSTPQGTTERLAVKDVDRRGQRQQHLADTHTQDCTFQPAVNNPAPSQTVGSAASPGKATGASGGESAHERLYRAAMERPKSVGSPESEECTFKPQVDPEAARRFAHVKPHYAGSGSDVMEKVKVELDRRSGALAEKRRIAEAKEMALCTFSPRLGGGCHYEDRTRPVPISGLDRFFELRSLAIRKREEQQSREEQVFRPELSDARCFGVTIPVPFELSTTSLREARSQSAPWL